MAVDVSDKLGKQQLAGAFVVNRGFVKKSALNNAGSQVGGALGGVISAAGGAIANKTTPETETPKFRGLAYLAVTDSELVLFNAKQGMMSPSVGEEITRLPRNEIRSSEFHAGYVSQLTIHPNEGGSWELSVQRAYKKAGQAIAQELQAVIS